MNKYHFLKGIRMLAGLVFLAIGGLAGCIGTIWHEVSLENSFAKRFGDTWKAEYENTVGSLSHAHDRVIAASVGVIVIPVLGFWTYKLLKAAAYNKSGRRDREPMQRRESPESQRARALRNAVVGVYFGLGGIAAAIALVLFRFHIFHDHDHELVLACLLFIAGYCGVISGCWWWLKAKNWTEGIVFIAFMPLMIAYVPFVRLWVFSQPLILISLMAMMTLILVAVVFVLPDKSGLGNRKNRRR